MIKMIRNTLFATLLSLPAFVCAAELAVVVSKNSPVSQISDAEVKQLFSGKLRNVNGDDVQTLDLASGNKHRNAFYQQLLGRNSNQMRSHWARLVFTGKARPPREVSSSREMASMVGSSNTLVGYIPASEVSDSLRVLKVVK